MEALAKCQRASLRLGAASLASSSAPSSSRAALELGFVRTGSHPGSRNLKTGDGCRRRARFVISAEAQAQRQRLENLSGIVTDENVPEGHKGLHGFLYGSDGASVHDSEAKEFLGRGREDDGTTILPFEEYVSARESVKFSGVFAIHNSDGGVEYIGYSRNVVLSLKTLRARVGQVKCFSVRVKLFSGASMVSKAKLEEERKTWIQFAAEVPPGNSHEINLWEGSNTSSGSVPLQHMTEVERKEYEEKKLKMRKAMGENLYDDVVGEDEDSKTIRMKLLQATEGDDWSSVIDGQTKQTIKTPGGAGSQIVSPFSKPANGRLYSAEKYELTLENVDLVLNEVRPYLISDGGNVEVVAVTDGVVSLRLQGACGTCPSSTTTMKMGIERVLNEKFGEALKGVVQADKQEAGATVASVNSHLDMVRPAITHYGGVVEVLSVSPCKGEAVVKFKGPAPIGVGIQTVIREKFPDITTVTLVEP